MKNTSTYLDFLKEKGRPLSDINPGSDEVALTVGDALEALELLKDSQTIILGGDILSEDENKKLGYAIHLWGYDYHYLNWYCDEKDNESKEDYSKRSYQVAKKAIREAVEISQQLKKDCFVVLVV